MCCRKNNLPALRLLIQYGADPNILFTDQETPLHIAVECCSWEVAWALVHEYKANPFAKDNNNQTPGDLCLLSLTPSKECSKALLATLFPCTQGDTLLHYAIRIESLRLCHYLLTYSCEDIGAKNNKGEKPADLLKNSQIDWLPMQLLRLIDSHPADNTPFHTAVRWQCWPQALELLRKNYEAQSTTRLFSSKQPSSETGENYIQKYPEVVQKLIDAIGIETVCQKSGVPRGRLQNSQSAPFSQKSDNMTNTF